jgi:hypothetical protein
MRRRSTFILERFRVRYFLHSDKIPNNFNEHTCHDVGRHSDIFASFGPVSDLEIHIFLFLYRASADDSICLLLFFGKPQVFAI